MMNMMQAMSANQEEIDRARRLEQIRRKGHKFIHVLYVGELRHPDPRLHDVHDMVLVETTNAETGQVEFKTRPGTSTLLFDIDPITGDRTAHVLDDDFNRQFLANHNGMGIKAVDKALDQEIQMLIGKSYPVEVSKSEGLRREKRRIELELREAEDEEEDEARKESGDASVPHTPTGVDAPPVKKRRGRPPTKKSKTVVERQQKAAQLNRDEPVVEPASPPPPSSEPVEKKEEGEYAHGIYKPTTNVD